jgi:hypothetical protein
MKIVEQYRQNITICSIPAYHQNKGGNAQQSPMIIGAEDVGG